jgi:alpha-D-ribose 1-methylphosphonate 5-triphosphate diphosphatase
MKNQFYLTGAQVVLENETLKSAAVLIENGEIVAINPASSGGAQEIDLSGHILMPGMIDLHCDALEKEAEPRPGVHFPFDFACTQADKRNTAAGITTVYHALSFANAELGVRNNQTAAALARAVHSWQEHALVDNRVHARYEITDPTAPAVLHELLANNEIHLMSFMDHTPGQGQFKDTEAYRNYLARTYKKSPAEIDALLADKLAQGDGSFARMQELANVARHKGIPLASHDDDRPEKISIVTDLGVRILSSQSTLRPLRRHVPLAWQRCSVRRIYCEASHNQARCVRWMPLSKEWLIACAVTILRLHYCLQSCSCQNWPVFNCIKRSRW